MIKVGDRVYIKNKSLERGYKVWHVDENGIPSLETEEGIVSGPCLSEVVVINTLAELVAAIEAEKKLRETPCKPGDIG